jgi:NitT/TauT family transport system ATP-binding protein
VKATNEDAGPATALARPVLAVDAVRIAYWLNTEKRVFRAVHDASFTVNEHEMVAIVGPSGCGKSSLLAAIAGLIPYTGDILLKGTKVTRPNLDTTIVFQRPALLPWMRVKDNVAYGLRAMGTPKAQAIERAMHMLDVVGLTGYGTRFPYQLSGGMQQRVGLARAMAARPALLLLDEPFAAVDALTRETLQNDLLDMWERRERSGILVTHQLDEAVLLADQVVVMSKGPESRIKDIVPVDLPRPRTAESRYSRRFTELTKILADLLQVNASHGRAHDNPIPRGDKLWNHTPHRAVDLSRAGTDGRGRSPPRSCWPVAAATPRRRSPTRGR